MRKPNKVKKIKAWAVIERGKIERWERDCTQFDIFDNETAATTVSEQWKLSGIKTKVVPVEITYKLSK